MIEEQTQIHKTSHPIPKKLSLLIKLNQIVSKKATQKLALKLFLSPIKYPTPEREQFYKNNTILSREKVNEKQITVYQEGQSKRKILLVHGWSGRATQFYKMAPAIGKTGFMVYSLTAPAHGSSTDTQTDLLEVVDCIKYLDKNHGPFEAIIGHSLGATAILNAINDGVKTNKVIAIGASGYIKEVVEDFCRNLGFNKTVEDFLLNYLKKNYAKDYEQFSFLRLAKSMTIPCLLIHDEDDKDVAISNARQNHKAWKNSELMETKGLGHRLILSDETVINRIITFLN